MTENDLGPPDLENPPAVNEGASTPPDTGNLTPFDELRGRQRRRESAVRMVGENPDPEHPGRRYHRPSTGLRADGYRQGYVAALRYVLRESGPQLNDLTRAKLAAIIKRSHSQ
jgi:hypothetical protein